MTTEHTYLIIYKPFQVLSQFSSPDGRKCLKDFFIVPANVYPVGRLDYDSEGLLLLTSDETVNHRLLHPDFAHEREYWLQVEGMMDQPGLDKLQSGVPIGLGGKTYQTKACQAAMLKDMLQIAARHPPIRFRKNIPTSWISLILQEGKNRQVRKMTAAVGFPTLRLIRYRIASLTITGLKPGESRILSRKSCYEKMQLDEKTVASIVGQGRRDTKTIRR